MRSKNSARITAAESAHMALVKESGCVTCEAGPYVEAHHVEQGCHYTVIGLCPDCHRGPKGIHGDQTMLRLRFKSVGLRGEMLALNETLARVYGDSR